MHVQLLVPDTLWARQRAAVETVVVAPGRVFRAPSGFLNNVDPAGDPVHIRLDR